jgi:hypothetical protein
LAGTPGTPTPAAGSVDSQEEEDCLGIVHPLVASWRLKSALVQIVPGVHVSGDDLSDCPAVLPQADRGNSGLTALFVRRLYGS